MHQLAYEQDVWKSNTTDPKALVTRDTVYNAALLIDALPIFFIGAIILWSYLAVSREDNYNI